MDLFDRATPMTTDELKRAAAHCPACGVATFIHGKGSQIVATLITDGTPTDGTGPGRDGAITEYRCLPCGHVWRLEWPDDSIFIA